MSGRFTIEGGGELEGFVLPRGCEASGCRRVPGHGGVEVASPRFDEAATVRLFETLRRAGRALRARPVAERVEAIGRACDRFRTPDDPVRSEALRLLPAQGSLSHAGAVGVIDAMSADWTADRLAALVRSEFPHGTAPGGGFGAPAPDPEGRPTRRVAVPSELTLTISSGTVPGVSVTAAIRSLLVGSGTLVKPGAGDLVLPLLFARALGEVDAELADALAVIYWPGGEDDLEDRALADADRVVVYGGSETIRSVRTRASTSATLVEYRHRVGIAVIGVERASPAELDALAEGLADAVVPCEQRGCVSPVRVHAIGSRGRVCRFAERLARVLAAREERVPGARTPEEASAAHQLLGSLELRRASGAAVDLWSGSGWIVAVEPSDELYAGGRGVL
ncbi:MAG: acyl-CoA reductase, partial [Longimicrobiales bacterium]|nr:acyl-CoA reductase [Longimicrobiales bacterium]